MGKLKFCILLKFSILAHRRPCFLSGIHPLLSIFNEGIEGNKNMSLDEGLNVELSDTRLSDAF